MLSRDEKPCREMALKTTVLLCQEARDFKAQLDGVRWLKVVEDFCLKAVSVLGLYCGCGFG
jgi:hypothetical protein